MSGHYVRIFALSAILFALAAAVIAFSSDQSDADTSGTCGDGVAWEFDSDSRTLNLTYTGSGTGRMDDHDASTEFPYARYWKGIDHVVIGEGVTYIGKCAFTGFTIKTVEFPSTLDEVGFFALESNEITAVDLKNVSVIGKGAFYECKSLTSVVIPSTVVSIGDYAFDLCNKLVSVDTSGATSLTSIGRSAFVNTLISTFYVPATVTSLGTGMFVECYSLETIDIDPANTHYIVQDGAVYNPEMTTVLFYPPKRAAALFEIPNTVTTIGKAAFATAQHIQAVSIPDSVTTIGDNAFEKCVSLTTIKIPNTVTHIGQFAFNQCIGIESIDFSGTTALVSMDDGAFLDCVSLKSVEIPACVVSLGVRVFGQCGSLETIYIDPSNPYYATVDGILYDKSLETLKQYPGGYNATEFTIPSTVKTIELNAFSMITKLESLIIPDSVTTISDGAVTCPSYLVKLTKVSFGNGLTTFTGEHPFITCHFLDKDGTEFAQTVENLRGRTFAGTNAGHMYLVDDEPAGSGEEYDAVEVGSAAAIIAVVVLIAIVAVMYRNRR